MVFDGARAEEELRSDLAVGQPAGDEPGDLQLLRGELIQRRWFALARRLAGGAQFILGAFGPRRRPNRAEELDGLAQVASGV